MEQKINWGRTLSARIEVNNACVENAPYRIAGIASMENDKVISITDCTVISGDITQATFSTWNSSGLNITYTDPDMQGSVEILQAVNAFVDDVKTSKN